MILGGAFGFWGYPYVVKKRLEAKLTFQPHEFGILFARLRPVTRSQEEQTKGESFLSTAAFDLEEYINNKNDINVKMIETEIIPFFEHAQDVESFAKHYGANLVIWGEIDGGTEQILLHIQSVKSDKTRYALSQVFHKGDIADIKVAAEFFRAGDMKRLLSFILGYTNYMRLEDPKELKKNALKYFEKAKGFRDQLNNAYVHFYMGNVYYFTDQFDLAEKQYKELLIEDREKIKSEFQDFGLQMEVFNNLGLLALKQNQLEEALKYFRTAKDEGKCLYGGEALSPGCVSLLYNFCNVFLEKEEYAVAAEYGEKAIKLFDQFKDDFLKSFLLQIRNDTALAYIERKDQQNSTRLQHAKSHLAEVARILEQDVSNLLELKLNAAHGALHRNWGRIYLKEDDWEHALKSFEQSRIFDPDNPKVYLLLAQLYDERCQQEDNIRIAEN
ncbi:MAG: hypothetical protein D3923_16775, partial [Candidatus Electrothrix sp. AR3]|nr:hypothetical protein [Candidatus Electrothrix sp. AR3]